MKIETGEKRAGREQIARSPTKVQLGRFKEAARALECDDDPKAFRKVMEKIAKAKPQKK